MSSTSREEYEIEVLASCSTNTEPGSKHDRPVEPNLLWSYAQEEALVAVSEQGPDKVWRLITDPERRAKRIAARYADLYFKSADKSAGKLQLYWVALAAFVVKDIVAAFEYSRENVFSGGILNAVRTSEISKLVSQAWSGASPYEHAARVYAALAKGNIWLFMDIFPWMWFVLEYGIRPDGSINEALLKDHVTKRSTSALQQQSRCAVPELPFGSNWLARCVDRQAADSVYAQARAYFSEPPVWGGMHGGYGSFAATAHRAHDYVKRNIKDQDGGYRIPPSKYWAKFSEAFYVLEEERKEMRRLAGDVAAKSRLASVAEFKVTKEIIATYEHLISQAKADLGQKNRWQSQELNSVAWHEQINVLQPTIYADPEFIETLDTNHKVARAFGSFFSQPYILYLSASPVNSNPKRRVVFDEPKNPWDRITGPKKSLPNPEDRMQYVAQIADKFNDLMLAERNYMEGELRQIQRWINA